MKKETLDEMLRALEDAGLIKIRWDAKKKDFVPEHTPLGAAIAKFMKKYKRLPDSDADYALCNKWMKDSQP